jgi:hypothetical protein
MFDLRIRAGVAALAIVIGTSVAMAQTQPSTLPQKPATTTQNSSKPSTMDEVKNWTQEKWDSMKTTWQ